MSRKKHTYVKKAFESTGTSSDVSANIYETMLLSPAWLDLSASQKVLYLTCKAQYYAEKHKPVEDDVTTFTMNLAKWADKYQLYAKSNQRSFHRDMAALISHGFVSCVSSGKITRTKSIYRFSSKWQRYGEADFEILPNEMNGTLLNELNKSPK